MAAVAGSVRRLITAVRQLVLPREVTQLALFWCGRVVLHHGSGVGGQRRGADVTLASEGGGARLLVRDVLLRDGATLRLHAPVPPDFEDIRAFYDSLSPESRYFRFHGYGRTDTVSGAGRS